MSKTRLQRAMPGVRARIAGLIATSILSTATHGAIIGSGGSTTVIAAPASAALGANQSNTQVWAFGEVSNFTLTSGLSVDASTPGVYTSEAGLTPAIIAPGTVINSHYLYSDPVAGTTAAYEGFVDLDQPVLGVIVLRAGLNASDFLGAPGTLYADNAARGMELSNNERFVITIAGTRVSYRFNTSTATDDIRIITAVPAPGVAGLLGGAGLIALRRRRSQL